jgi:hypothetical protein
VYRIEERGENALVLRQAPVLADPGRAVTNATVVALTVGVLVVVTPLGFLLDRLLDWAWLTPLSGAAALAGLSVAGLSARFLRHGSSPAQIVIDRRVGTLRLGSRAPDVPFDELGVPHVIERHDDDEQPPWYQVALRAGKLELLIGAFDDRESAEREVVHLKTLLVGCDAFDAVRDTL